MYGQNSLINIYRERMISIIKQLHNHFLDIESFKFFYIESNYFKFSYPFSILMAFINDLVKIETRKMK